MFFLSQESSEEHNEFADFIILVQVRLTTEVLCTPSSTQPGFELKISSSWQYILCHWGTCANHLAISDFLQLSNITQKEEYMWLISTFRIIKC